MSLADIKNKGGLFVPGLEDLCREFETAFRPEKESELWRLAQELSADFHELGPGTTADEARALTAKVQRAKTLAQEYLTYEDAARPGRQEQMRQQARTSADIADSLAASLRAEYGF